VISVQSASTRKDEAIFNEIQSQLKHNNVTVDVKATSESNVSGNVCYYLSITTPFTNFNLPVTVALFLVK
jgi:hypothetical protein